MVAASFGKTPHDYSSPSSSVRLNDTDVVLYLHSDHQSESEPHTGSIPTGVSPHKAGLQEIKKHDTTTEPETTPTQHCEPNQSETTQKPEPVPINGISIRNPRREEPAGPQQKIIPTCLFLLVSRLVWKWISLATTGCCPNDCIHLGRCVCVSERWLCSLCGLHGCGVCVLALVVVDHHSRRNDADPFQDCRDRGRSCCPSGNSNSSNETIAFNKMKKKNRTKEPRQAECSWSSPHPYHHHPRPQNECRG